MAQEAEPPAGRAGRLLASRPAGRFECRDLSDRLAREYRRGPLTLGGAGGGTLAAGDVMSVGFVPIDVFMRRLAARSAPGLRPWRRIRQDRIAVVRVIGVLVVILVLMEIAVVQADLPPRSQTEISTFLTDLSVLIGGLGVYLAAHPPKK
jgi:hypothetical protein